MFLPVFLVSGFLAGIAVSYAWLWLAQSLRWFDYPNQRSSHTRPTPKGGGLGFALVFLGALAWLERMGLADSTLAWLCVPGLMLAVLGLADDLRELGIALRLGVQLVAVGVGLVLIPVVPVPLLPGIVLESHWLLLLFTGFAWVWHINLYNFMDGTDGLAAVQGIFVALSLGGFAAAAGQGGSALALLALSSVLAGFICFNWAPARLFMGDAGSNFLGYVLVALGLQLVADGVITAWTLLILLAVFISDSTTTLLSRMRSGAVWYHGHRSHAYQLLAQASRSHARVAVGVLATNVVWILPLAWLSVQEKEWGAVLALLAFAPLVAAVKRCHRRYLGGNLNPDAR